MKSFTKFISKIFQITLGIGSIFMIGCQCFAADSYQGKDHCIGNDLLGSAFCTSLNATTIIDAWNTKQAVGDYVFNEWLEVDVGKKIEINKRPSLIVKFTKLILTLTIVLSVTMIIINGIIYIVKTGNWEEPSEVKKNIIYVIIGIILALCSGVLVTLFRSVGTQTIKKVWHLWTLQESDQKITQPL